MNRNDKDVSQTESHPMRKCEFCGCNTNARKRACCNKGRDADSVVSEATPERIWITGYDQARLSTCRNGLAVDVYVTDDGESTEYIILTPESIAKQIHFCDKCGDVGEIVSYQHRGWCKGSINSNTGNCTGCDMHRSERPCPCRDNPYSLYNLRKECP